MVMLQLLWMLRLLVKQLLRLRVHQLLLLLLMLLLLVWIVVGVEEVGGGVVLRLWNGRQRS